MERLSSDPLKISGVCGIAISISLIINRLQARLQQARLLTNSLLIVNHFLSRGRLSDIPVTVLRGDPADNPAGVAGCQDTLGDVVDDDGPAADDGARPDGHTRHHAHHPADPDIIADSNGKRILQFPSPKVLVQRMSRRIETALRGYEHVVAESDLRLVQDDAVRVNKNIVPHFDIRPVVAEEGRIHDEVFPDFADEFAKESVPSFQIRNSQCVVILAHFLRPEQFPQEFSIRSVIQTPGHHFVADTHLDFRFHARIAGTSLRRNCS